MIYSHILKRKTTYYTSLMSTDIVRLYVKNIHIMHVEHCNFMPETWCLLSWPDIFADILDNSKERAKIVIEALEAHHGPHVSTEN